MTNESNDKAARTTVVKTVADLLAYVAKHNLPPETPLVIDDKGGPMVQGFGQTYARIYDDSVVALRISSYPAVFALGDADES